MKNMTAGFANWLTGNWKPLLAVASAIFGLGFGAVQDIKGEINHLDREHTEEITKNTSGLRDLQSSVGEIRCMLVLEAEGGNPLDCIDLKTRR